MSLPPFPNNMALLEVKDVRRSFGGLVAVNQVSFNGHAGPDQGRHRPQRRGQDDPVQHHLRPAQGRRRAGHFQGPLHHRLQAVSNRPRGHFAHVPESQPVLPDERSGKRDGGPAQPFALGIRRVLPASSRPAEGGTLHPRSRAGATGLRRPRPARRASGRRAVVRPAPHGGTGPRAGHRSRNCCCSTSPPAD